MAFSPFKFLQEVRSETAKVTWPTRRETTITTIMVFVMVALASIFFFAWPPKGAVWSPRGTPYLDLLPGWQ